MQAPNYSVEKAWGLRVGAGDPGVYWSNMCQAMVFLNCLISGNFEQLQTECHPFHGYTVHWETKLFFSEVVDLPTVSPSTIFSWTSMALVPQTARAVSMKLNPRMRKKQRMDLCS